MESLVRQLIPHAPHLGLYVAPDIPDQKLVRALRRFGENLPREQVIALYDATRLGTASDGALFTPTSVFIRNSLLQPRQSVHYKDIVGVKTGRRLLAGRFVDLQVNRGKATIALRIHFAARPEAAEYVSRLLAEAMLADPAAGDLTNAGLVEQELRRLVRRGILSDSDMGRMMKVLGKRG